MRIGVNPEKYKNLDNKFTYHRIIMVCYIPNVYEDYYKDSLSILENSIKSLIKTINFETTSITFINNDCCEEINVLLQNYLPYFDKYLRYQENKGKVYSVLSEARASYESFITITDCDVLFLEGWEKAVIKTFKNFPKAGVVSPLPMPNLAFSHNYSFFYDNFFKYKYGKTIDQEELDVYLKGMGNDSLLNRNNKKYNWREKHYFLKDNSGNVAIAGAGHFVSTYRKEIFNVSKDFPSKKFMNGFEDLFIDKPSDMLGLYRLSLNKCYVYHMGNRMDDFISSIKYKSNSIMIDKKDFDFINIRQKQDSISKTYHFKKFLFKVLKKINYIK